MNRAYRTYIFFADSQQELFRKLNSAEHAVTALHSELLATQGRSQCNVYFNMGELLVSKPNRSRKTRWQTIKDTIQASQEVQ